MNPQFVPFLLFLSVLLMAVVAHEVAHAWQARREGDPTAESLGRITLNPLPHLDFVGSFLVPGLLFFGSAVTGGSGFLFGWAKPVPVNPAYFRDHPWSDIRVSLAGIVANLILTVAFIGVSVVLVLAGDLLGIAGQILLQLASFGVLINLLLAFFNLIPIPPLDGSHVVAHLLPPAAAARYRAMGRYGVPLLFGIMILFPQALGLVLSPVWWVQGLVDSLLRGLA